MGTAWLALVIVSAAGRAEDPAAAETKKLDGVWQAVEVQTKGKTAGRDDPEVKGLRLVIAGNRIAIPHPTEQDKGRKSTFQVNPSRSPKHIDITSLDGPEKGQTSACIYKLEKDRLTLCMPYFTRDTSVRPKEFKAGADDGLLVLILERARTK
jgi:RNA polymerase sigma-70 factor (ECF subfamily)